VRMNLGNVSGKKINISDKHKTHNIK